MISQEKQDGIRTQVSWNTSHKGYEPRRCMKAQSHGCIGLQMEMRNKAAITKLELCRSCDMISSFFLLCFLLLPSKFRLLTRRITWLGVF